MDFLKSPRKYIQVGARIPKGRPSGGPSGNRQDAAGEGGGRRGGRAVLQHIRLGFRGDVRRQVGASRVRDLFEDAKKNAPCIIFIDEIDAVARKKMAPAWAAGHDEREQTLNQLLVEMDGFGVNEGIIVMAGHEPGGYPGSGHPAPGPLRPQGRGGTPRDVKGREEILKVHAKGKPLGGRCGPEADRPDDSRIYRRRPGEPPQRGGDPGRAKEGRVYLQQTDIRKAFVKVGIGAEEEEPRDLGEKEKKITAYHEAGHAILFHVSAGCGAGVQCVHHSHGSRGGGIHHASAGAG